MRAGPPGLRKHSARSPARDCIRPSPTLCIISRHLGQARTNSARDLAVVVMGYFLMAVPLYLRALASDHFDWAASYRCENLSSVKRVSMAGALTCSLSPAGMRSGERSRGEDCRRANKRNEVGLTSASASDVGTAYRSIWEQAVGLVRSEGGVFCAPHATSVVQI